MKINGEYSKSGVFKYSTFREQVVIDRYHVQLQSFNGLKKEHMRSDNSEDICTWNCFRTLNQLSPNIWINSLFERSFGQSISIVDGMDVQVSLWTSVSPPKGIPWKEGDSEIDVVIEWEGNVWFIEAKYKSDVSLEVVDNEDRDQVWRNIDVGSCANKGKKFHFSLLYWTREKTPVGIDLVTRYSDKTALISKCSSYRDDGLTNWTSIGLLTWQDLGDCLSGYAEHGVNVYEETFIQNLQEWAKKKGIWR